MYNFCSIEKIFTGYIGWVYTCPCMKSLSNQTVILKKILLELT